MLLQWYGRVIKVNLYQPLLWPIVRNRAVISVYFIYTNKQTKNGITKKATTRENYFRHVFLLYLYGSWWEEGQYTAVSSVLPLHQGPGQRATFTWKCLLCCQTNMPSFSLWEYSSCFTLLCFSVLNCSVLNNSTLPQAHCFALCQCCDFFACDCRMQVSCYEKTKGSRMLWSYSNVQCMSSVYSKVSIPPLFSVPRAAAATTTPPGQTML